MNHHKFTNALHDLHARASELIQQKDERKADTVESHKPINYLATSEHLEISANMPKIDVSSLKLVIHGSEDLAPYLDPLDDNLRHEIIKYGEFAQATYDAFDFNSFSSYCGSCMYGMDRMFDKLELRRNGYTVTTFLYAMSRLNMPHWLEKSFHPKAWNHDSNWMGYVAVSGDAETERIGCRDVLVTWRGTIAPTEWLKDMDVRLEHFGGKNSDAKVAHGYYGIYTSKSEDTKYNQRSAQDQVLEELKRPIPFFKSRGEYVSLTLSGHGLGGALCFLTAYDAAQEFPDLPITVITFGGPRVGNKPFCEKLKEKKIKVIRVVVRHDIVPHLPGIPFNKKLEKVENLAESWHGLYTHYGYELNLEVKSSPYLKQMFDLVGYHNLEMYLHLVDGHISSNGSEKFREDAKRDVALVNKWSGMLKKETLVPSCWYQPAFKGLVCNKLGRWVIPEREPEDVPPPPGTHVPLSVFN
ncbi:Alpha/beta-Hydrolases superfamily protein [Rhynchospora pubera]|uniref:Alpha/beta-Hydrolases superfamily protein n=1 Tax=Rhynchospora pubera TaxID=906938 RepID=A0AAV8GUB5_9POAL|nr:Alpha/beta-Hydrolases superfamily protein [Rhynchospora pubera]